MEKQLHLEIVYADNSINAQYMKIIDFFHNSTSAGNLCVDPVLESSRTLKYAAVLRSVSPTNSLAEASYERSLMENGLNEQAKVKKGLDAIKSFSFACFDNDKNFVAGVDGKSFYGCLYIDMLWISENFRGQNYGTLLMAKVEDIARERNCKIMTYVLPIGKPDHFMKN